MNSPKTAEGLRKLIAVSFIMQNMSGKDLVEDKVTLSLGLQEIAKYLGDAHGLDWGDLVEASLKEIIAAVNENDSAKDLATDAILRAMGKKAI